MRTFTANEVSITHSAFLELRSLGKVRLGIDDAIALKLAQTGLMPKTSTATAALHTWSFVAVSIFLVAVYFSFADAWWWFIPGFFLMLLIHSGNKRGNSENLLEIAERDPFFYEKVRQLGMWQYQMDVADAEPYLPLAEAAASLVGRYDTLSRELAARQLSSQGD